MNGEVNRLLEAGASVDDLDSSGASALLCAIQHAEATGQREALDLLLARPHQITTLHTLTSRKRLTPLMCAIDLGLPDVVAALIGQGVDVEQKALTDNQSPLYLLGQPALLQDESGIHAELLESKDDGRARPCVAGHLAALRCGDGRNLWIVGERASITS